SRESFLRRFAAVRGSAGEERPLLHLGRTRAAFRTSARRRPPALGRNGPTRSLPPDAGIRKMKMEQKLKIAVFIDFDNIEIGVKSTLHREFDVAAVQDGLK